MIESALFMVLLVAIGAGGWFAGYLHGYLSGVKDYKVLTTIESQGVQIKVNWQTVEALLDRKGLIAVPKGAEFNPQPLDQPREDHPCRT